MKNTILILALVALLLTTSCYPDRVEIHTDGHSFWCVHRMGWFYSYTSDVKHDTLQEAEKWAKAYLPDEATGTVVETVKAP